LPSDGTLFPCSWACFSLPSSAWCQDSVNEQRAISGNSATIVVNVRDSSGGPLSVSAIVKLAQYQGIPNGQATTS